MTDYWINHAIKQVKESYGDNVEIKPKSLLKFGKNAAVGTSTETVWLTGGNETYPTTNAIDKFSSSDAGDTQNIVVEGHTIDANNDFTFVTQEVTLVGQTETALTTNLARCSRLYNNGTSDFAGTVYVYEDDTVVSGVPQTAAKIHAQTEGTNNQTLKAATTISKSDYWFIRTVYAVVNEKTAATVDFQLQVREKGKVFRTRIPFTAASTGPAAILEIRPYLIVPKNADFRIRAKSSAADTSVEAWANGPLARVI